MKNFFPVLGGLRPLRVAALALGLLGGATAAQAQGTPAIVYALGTVTQGFTFGGITYATGNQTLTAIDPTTGTYAAGAMASPSIGYVITGITAGQVLVGIDYRTANGDLYALGFNASAAAAAANAQVYTLRVNGASSALLTPVGGPIRLELADNNRANTRGVIPNIGFDFNPRLDRIRVVAPNGANYRLDPNTGGIAGQDANLTYVAGAVSPPAATPYIGTAAYTNSRVGLRGTTLYDIDVTNTNAVLSTPSQPNDGKLSPVAKVQFLLPGSSGGPGPYPLTSPTVGLGLDVYNQTTAYLVEARLADNTQTTVTPTTRYTNNFYTFDLGTGLATRVANIIGSVTLFYSDIAAPILLPKVWTGQVSSAWGNANNWYPVGVPTSTDDVGINGNGTYLAAINATVTNQPVVSDAQQAASVTLNNNALLTTNDGGTLTLAGDFVNNDSRVAGTGTGIIVLAGSAAADISGNTATSFWNLGVGANGAGTSAAVSIQRSAQVSGTLAIGSSQAFTLLSSASGTAYVVNNGSGVITGTATVQRYIDPSRNGGLGYRHYSAPVTNTTIGDLTTTNFTPTLNADYNTSATPGRVRPFPTVYGYNQTQYENSPGIVTATFQDFDKGYYSPTALTDAMPSGLGFTVNIPASEQVDFVGTLGNGAISTPAQGRSAKANAGWQLLGNPYPSALDWNQVAASGLSGIDNAVYVFKSSSQYAGSYASYVNGVATNGGSRYIPVAQAFFVRTSAVGGTGNINFTNAQRATDGSSAPFQRTTADVRPQLLLELGNGQAASQTAVYFENGATAAYDKAYDAAALPFLNGLTLGSVAGTDLLSINGQPALAGAVTVPLQVAVATAGTYSLRAAELANLPAGYHAYLRDASLNTYTDLATTPTATLSLTASSADAGRFALLFTSASPLATAPASLAALASVYPSPARGTATLVLPKALRGTGASTVQLLNTLGQVVLTRTLAAGAADALELPLTGLAAGIYTVRASTAAGLVAKRLVVQ